MNVWTTILLILAGALAMTGALYRLTPTGTWPPAVRWIGASAWYLLAALGGALGALLLVGRDSDDSNKSSPGGDRPPPPEPDVETAADELEQETEGAVEDEQSPSAEELVDDLNELSD